MTARIRNPHYPWNVARLVQRCKTWNFDSDLDQFDEDDDEPYAARASRRIQDAMRAWRNTHPPERDPLR